MVVVQLVSKWCAYVRVWLHLIVFGEKTKQQLGSVINSRCELLQTSEGLRQMNSSKDIYEAINGIIFEVIHFAEE